MRAASVLSTHPVVATALGEAVGQLLEALGGLRPALVMVAVTPPHLGTLEDVGAALTTLLAPDVVMGAVATAVIGGGRLVEREPAVALLALGGVAASALSVVRQADGDLVRHGRLEGATAAVVLADPFSCPASTLLEALGPLPASGGLVGAALGSGGSRLLLDGRVRTAGAVGALLGPPAQAVASQGGSPAGEPWVVTRTEADMVLELGGRPAVERRCQALGDEDQAGALGLVVDEHSDEVGRAELLRIPILGFGTNGGLRVARPIPVGRVVRFLRTGAVDTEADLLASLRLCGSDSYPADGPLEGGPTGVLLFPGAGREGDAELASELLGCPIAGVGVTAPLAPVGGVPSLHGPGTTGLVLFP